MTRRIIVDKPVLESNTPTLSELMSQQNLVEAPAADDLGEDSLEASDDLEDSLDVSDDDVVEDDNVVVEAEVNTPAPITASPEDSSDFSDEEDDEEYDEEEVENEGGFTPAFIG